MLPLPASRCRTSYFVMDGSSGSAHWSLTVPVSLSGRARNFFGAAGGEIKSPSTVTATEPPLAMVGNVGLPARVKGVIHHHLPRALAVQYFSTGIHTGHRHRLRLVVVGLREGQRRAQPDGARVGPLQLVEAHRTGKRAVQLHRPGPQSLPLSR